jgi:hypothetical protein
MTGCIASPKEDQVVGTEDIFENQMLDAANRLHRFKQTIRRPNTKLGGYAIGLYLQDGERICIKCARDNWFEIVSDTLDGVGSWQAGFVGAYWEGPPMYCVQCNEPQASEYGDPDNKLRLVE